MLALTCNKLYLTQQTVSDLTVIPSFPASFSLGLSLSHFHSILLSLPLYPTSIPNSIIRSIEFSHTLPDTKTFAIVLDLYIAVLVYPSPPSSVGQYPAKYRAIPQKILSLLEVATVMRLPQLFVVGWWCCF